MSYICHHRAGPLDGFSIFFPLQSKLIKPAFFVNFQGSSGSKFILISPPARSLTTSFSSGEGKSPSKRVRDGKKCRKVYGLEQRDLWCTQCKWKKACARFGAHATEPLPPSSPTTVSSNSNPTSVVQIAAPMSVVTTGSSLPSASATTVLTGVKAIKF